VESISRPIPPSDRRPACGYASCQSYFLDQCARANSVAPSYSREFEMVWNVIKCICVKRRVLFQTQRACMCSWEVRRTAVCHSQPGITHARVCRTGAFACHSLTVHINSTGPLALRQILAVTYVNETVKVPNEVSSHPANALNVTPLIVSTSDRRLGCRGSHACRI
jgi:hypothetical protein